MEGQDFLSPAANLSSSYPFTLSVLSFKGNETGNQTVGQLFEGGSSMVTALISITVFVMGLTGNTLAIYVVLRYTKMKTVTNMYILNLAVADELYILGLPFVTTQNVLSYWPFGEFLCRVVMTTDTLNQFTSIFCLTVMSIDRYMAVVHPIRSTKLRRPRVAKIINAIVWGLSFLVVIPVVIFSTAQNHQRSCNISWPEPRGLWPNIFIFYTATLGFFLPLLVICLCYLLIVIKVKSTGARVGLAKRRKSERKVTRMVVVIVVVFVICWLPFYILNIVNLVNILPESSLMAGIYFFSVTLTYFNSCANPLLYGFLSENFKQSFRKVLCIHRANGVADGELGRSEDKVQRQSTFLSTNSDANGHVQNAQSVQMEVSGTAKAELLPFEPAVIGQSTL
ncbi:somatostatin receptor type 5-like [Denticeps clupeoides]|uniref:G-protein coupled receptors family 1 profile domain-containing protein n=1 Tax=Denticeps clupeoides TaxID=299321 RepID=A0AAY4AWL0_9TELE|nr:somatostatin receptor type 5-like [Denticeps clupeoides]XP_028843107.1 somatostatin receptor type 5-like [Denticeps clupeoides]XP_028843108.1 somatostatin receptor type 5-like [Denticeps clupeoides]